MPKIVTLKDNNDDIVYPITPIDAVFTDTSVTLENMIDAKADTDLTNVVNGSVTTAKIANDAINTDKIADSAVTSDKIDWTTIAWEALSITVPSGVTIVENHCAINHTLKLVSVHLGLQLSNGCPSTLASGFPTPFNGSKYIDCSVTGGNLLNRNLNCWIRASGGTIGAQTASQSDVTGVNVYGVYPIA